MDRNIYRMNAEERKEAGISSLPASLSDALDSLAQDEVILNALGDHIYLNYKEAKEIEFDLYRTAVHQWERDQYIKMY